MIAFLSLNAVLMGFLCVELGCFFWLLHNEATRWAPTARLGTSLRGTAQLHAPKAVGAALASQIRTASLHA